MVQWLGLGAFTAMGLGSIPGRGTKILQASQGSWEKKKAQGRRPWEDRDRDWSYAVVSQGMPVATRSSKDSPLDPLEGVQPCQYICYICVHSLFITIIYIYTHT